MEGASGMEEQMKKIDIEQIMNEIRSDIEKEAARMTI